MSASPSPAGSAAGAGVIVALLEQLLEHDPTKARMLLSLPALTRDPRFAQALLEDGHRDDSVQDGATNHPRRLRLLRNVVAALLDGVRERQAIPATAFVAESQVDTSATASTQNVLWYDATQQQQDAATQPQDGLPEASPLVNGLHLYMLLAPCRAGAAAADPADPVTAVLEALEADRRATVSLDSLSKALRKGSNGAGRRPRSGDAPAVEVAPDVDSASAPAAAAYAVEAEHAIAEIEAKTKRHRSEQAAATTDGIPPPAAPAQQPAEQAEGRSSQLLLPPPAGGLIVEADDFDAVDLPDPSSAAAAAALAPRLRLPFTDAEDRAILDGVGMFKGVGRFADILRHYRDAAPPGEAVFHETRTAAGLADHFRQTLRRRRLLGQS
jgi:hypothetical protein